MTQKNRTSFMHDPLQRNRKNSADNYVYKVKKFTVTIPQLIDSCIRTTHLCIMVILQNLKERNPPFSLRERYFNTHFLGLWKMRRNDLLIYSFSHRIETTFSLNSNLIKILRKLTFEVGYCLNSVEIFHVEYPSQEFIGAANICRKK